MGYIKKMNYLCQKIFEGWTEKGCTNVYKFFPPISNQVLLKRLNAVAYTLQRKVKGRVN